MTHEQFSPIPPKCSACGEILLKGKTKYVVSITSFADVDEELHIEELTEDALANMLIQMEDKSEEELNRSVYDKNVYLLCLPCREKFISNPFSK